MAVELTDFELQEEEIQQVIESLTEGETSGSIARENDTLVNWTLSVELVS
jgi:hypothetical protein